GRAIDRMKIPNLHPVDRTPGSSFLRHTPCTLGMEEPRRAVGGAGSRPIREGQIMAMLLHGAATRPLAQRWWDAAQTAAKWAYSIVELVFSYAVYAVMDAAVAMGPFLLPLLIIPAILLFALLI